MHLSHPNQVKESFCLVLVTVAIVYPERTIAQGQNPLGGLGGLGLGGLPIPNLGQLFGGGGGGQGGPGLGGLGIPGNQRSQGGLGQLTGSPAQQQGQPLGPLIGRLRGGT